MNKTETLYPNRLATQRWKRFNCAMEKQYIYSKPTQASIAYINDKDEAHTGVIDLTATNVITQDTLIGPAIDISIAYDARWRLTGTDNYDMYTIGEPYIAYVDTAKNLYVRRGSTGSILNLASNVDRCWIVRGWKHVTDPTLDQGLIVFYIKGNQLYSRSYVQQDATKYSWLTEEVYQAGAVVDIQAYRTADFRLAIACTQTTGTSRLLLTSRVFPGQSIPAEIMTFNGTEVRQATAEQVKKLVQPYAEYFKYKVNADNLAIPIRINCSIDDISIKNIGNTLITITAGLPYKDLILNDNSINTFLISDTDNISYNVISITVVDNMIQLIVNDMGNCTSDILINYIGGLYYKYGPELKAFAKSFTPTGLIPSAPEPPIVIRAYNTSSEVIE